MCIDGRVGVSLVSTAGIDSRAGVSTVGRIDSKAGVLTTGWAHQQQDGHIVGIDSRDRQQGRCIDDRTYRQQGRCIDSRMGISTAGWAYRRYRQQGSTAGPVYRR